MDTTVNPKLKETATLQQATETTTDQTLGQLHTGKFGTQTKRSNPKRKVNPRGQAQQPDLKFRGIYTVGWNYRRKRPNTDFDVSYHFGIRRQNQKH